MELLNKRKKSHRESLLALRLVPQLGIQRIRMLLKHADHPAEILVMPRPELQAVDGIGPAIADAILEFNEWDKVDRLLERSRRIGAQVISCYDEQYPDILREIYDPPLLLWVKGNADVLQSSGIAVIGTRRATHYGLSQAREYSTRLVEKGLTVVSGLAYGVDAAAHKATLQAGGKTVAVLGSGIDNIYPRKNAGIARGIIENEGAVITEFPPGTAPDAGNFPVRNRIVSGMTLGTLVVESGLKGGSMITAQSALTQNREVFVVPHSLENVNGIGCNHLIKRGAGKLVQTVNDILEELPGYGVQETETAMDAETRTHWKSRDLGEDGKTICRLLETNPMHIDDLSDKLELASHQLLAKLLELEMQGCVRQKAGKNFELI